ncbi:MAG: hypothetical protein V1789_00355 [PVC group bacterium]
MALSDPLQFYDVKAKGKVSIPLSQVRYEERKGRGFAVAKSPSGNYDCWRVLGKADAEQLKKMK